MHVYVSPGSAETLVRRGGIANHRLISYSLSNISAKNYQNQLMYVEVIVCNIRVIFSRHSVFVSPASITSHSAEKLICIAQSDFGDCREISVTW